MSSTSPAFEAAALRALLAPRSVALVGASERNAFTRPMLHTLRTVGFAGSVTLVHPKAQPVDGVACVASLAELPEVPDVVALLMGASRVLPAVREAAAAGVPAAIIYAGGFGDEGEEGAERQRELVAVAREAGMAILGPNCQGCLSPATRSGLYLLAMSDGYAAGDAALIAQSGSVADSIVNNVQGVRFGHIITTGNEAVVDATDALAHLVDDTSCATICLFLETIRRPRAFVEVCERARQAGKSIVLLKAARTAAGMAAAQAHTGAIAYPARLIDALLGASAVIRVDTLEELLAATVLLQTGRQARGPRVALVTVSGGMIELILDEADPLGLEFPALDGATLRALDGVFERPEQVKNPLDIWPPAIDTDAAFGRVFDAFAADPGIDVVALQSAVALDLVGASSASFGLEPFLAAAQRSDKPFVVLDPLPGGPPAAALERARAAGVAVLSGLPAGLAALDRVAHSQSRVWGRPPAGHVPHDPQGVADRVAQLAQSGAVSGTPALDLLAAIGLPVPPCVEAADVAAAVAAAEGLGLPVVLKDGDPARLHKTESGGVAVDLRTAEQVRAAASTMADRGATRFLVQQHVSAQHEILLGLQGSPELGTFIVCGLGGIWTEVLDDAVIEPVGLREGDAARMLERLRGYPALAGARGTTAVDLTALAMAIEALDWFGQRFGDVIESVDLNPVLALENGAVCVDAVFVPRAAAAGG